jgi:hypothetical protein
VTIGVTRGAPHPSRAFCGPEENSRWRKARQNTTADQWPKSVGITVGNLLGRAACAIAIGSSAPPVRLLSVRNQVSGYRANRPRDDSLCRASDIARRLHRLASGLVSDAREVLA